MLTIKDGAVFLSGHWKLRIAATRSGSLCVDVENPSGTWADRSICYRSGVVAYDFPERIPQFVKLRVDRLYRRMGRK